MRAPTCRRPRLAMSSTATSTPSSKPTCGGRQRRSTREANCPLEGTGVPISPGVVYLATVTGTAGGHRTLADLLERLGRISPARVRFRPPPGLAGEQDM